MLHRFMFSVLGIAVWWGVISTYCGIGAADARTDMEGIDRDVDSHFGLDPFAGPPGSPSSSHHSISFSILAADEEYEASNAASEMKCSFKLGDLQFDLCPILKTERSVRTIEFERQTPPTVTKTSYRIALRGPLKKYTMAQQNDDEECPEGTWVCLKVSNVRPDHPSEAPRLLQVVPVAGNLPLGANHTRERHPGLNATAVLGRKPENSTHPPLDIILHGGSYVEAKQSALLRFRCDQGAGNHTAPSYRWQYNGFHYFTWDTPHACPKALQNKPDDPTHTHHNTGTLTASTAPKSGPTQRTDPTEPSPDEQPVEGDDNDEKEEFLLPETPQDFSRKHGVTIVFGSLVLLAGVTYFTYTSLPLIHQTLDRFRRGKSSYGYKHKFRVGEQRLLRWAEEDDVDLGDDDSGDDFMINARAPHGDGGDGFDGAEDMPLAPSPRKVVLSHSRSYGSIGKGPGMPQ